MEKTAITIAVGITTILGMSLLAILGTLMGGAVGWVVGLFFGDQILGVAAQLGIRGVSMFQLGLFLGFVGGFLRTKISGDSK